MLYWKDFEKTFILIMVYFVFIFFYPCIAHVFYKFLVRFVSGAVIFVRTSMDRKDSLFLWCL